MYKYTPSSNHWITQYTIQRTNYHVPKPSLLIDHYTCAQITHVSLYVNLELRSAHFHSMFNWSLYLHRDHICPPLLSKDQSNKAWLELRKWSNFYLHTDHIRPSPIQISILQSMTWTLHWSFYLHTDHIRSSPIHKWKRGNMDMHLFCTRQSELTSRAQKLQKELAANVGDWELFFCS